MSIKHRLPLLGALVATPALTASVEPAVGKEIVKAHAPYTTIAEPGYVAALSALKAAMLAIAPSEKLAIAGDRLGADPTLTTLQRDGRIRRAAVVRATAAPPCTSMCRAPSGSVKGGTGAATAACTVHPEANKACGSSRIGRSNNTGPQCKVTAPELKATMANNACHSQEAKRSCGANTGGRQALTTHPTTSTGTPH
jgi:hypothetical protein